MSCILEYYLHIENDFGRDLLKQAFVQKLFYQICLPALQPYPSLKSPKAIYMNGDVWHTASSSLCSLLQSFIPLSYFNLLNLIDSCLNCVQNKILFSFSGW